MDTIYRVFAYVSLFPGIFGNPLIPANKLSLATWGSYHQQDHKGPGTYAFGYDIEDPVTGNVQFKQEERHPNGTITGNYGYVDANGKPHVVTYISDERGYRAQVEIEGELTQYFPISVGLPGNFLQNRPEGATQFLLNTPTSSDYVDNEVRGNENELSRRPPPGLYNLDFPSYFKYATINRMSK